MKKKKRIKKPNRMTKRDKALIVLISIVVLIPITLFFMDFCGAFTNTGVLQRLTTRYDWFAFLGTYISAFLSTIFLIYITTNDRINSDETTRQTQRPYLNIDFQVVNKAQILAKKREEDYIETEIEDSIEFALIEIPVLKITNAGNSVAIIAVDKMYVSIEYTIMERVEQGVITEEKVNEKTIYANEFIKRLTIPANQTVYIYFNNPDFDVELLIQEIGIKKCYIEYKDLYDCIYKDECVLEENKINVISDNLLMHSTII